MSELAFEALSFALEATPGTAESAPTSYMNLFGQLIPRETIYQPDESTGLLEAYMRQEVTRKWGEFSGDGPLDTDLLPMFLEMIVKGGVTPSQPGSTTSTYQWVYTPTMTADDLEFATIFWGDPNMTHILQGAYGMLTNLTIASDASGTDGATLSIAGMTQAPVKLANPVTMPTQAFSPLVASVKMQAYLDTSSAIGTTALVQRVVSAEHVLDSGITQKFVGDGPDADLSYSRHGRGKRSLITRMVAEMRDFTEYDVAQLQNTPAKLRIVHNGAFIENDGSDDYYHALQVDTYGKLHLTDYGELEGTNRTVAFEIVSAYDSTLGAGWSMTVLNEASALPS